MKTILATRVGTQASAQEVDWQAVYSDCLPRVFHFFCYKLGDTVLAEELTAVTFEKAWRGRANFRHERGEAPAWLMGIARKVAAEHFRRPRREEPLDAVPENRLAGQNDDTLQRRLDFQAILDLLAHYSSRERELISLKYGAELTNREIARLTGLSESNVGTILHRVVKRLRSEWEETHA